MLEWFAIQIIVIRSFLAKIIFILFLSITNRFTPLTYNLFVEFKSNKYANFKLLEN